jgi:protein-S-isoprenylcysteine O-methyltransferase Ste14
LLFLRTLFGVCLNVVILTLLLLTPSPNWYWHDAVIYLALYALLVLTGSIYLCLYHPESIKARLMAPYSTDQPKRDKLATIFLLGASAASLVLIPLDVHHFQIGWKPPFLIRSIGLLISSLGIIGFHLSLKENAFAQPVVSLQKSRGHLLVDSGIYSYIRHPMYSSFFLFYPGMAVWLESLFSATAGSLILISALIPRILIEESTLRQGLSGYDDYVRRVKYRIIPMVF